MIFGTDGIRAVFKEEPLTESTISKLSTVIRNFLPGKARVIMGMDTRESGHVVKTWLFSGWEGVTVLDLGVVPTPVVAFETAARKVDLGVMITASHNPFHDNGIKFFNSKGVKIASELAEKWSAEVLVTPTGFKKTMPILEHVKPLFYEGFLHQRFGPCELPLVFDMAHGAGCPWVESWVSHFLPQAVILGNRPSGKNINEGVGALHPGALAQEVLNRKAVAGFALDGDGDRLVVINQKGQVVHGDRLLYGLASIQPDVRLVVSTIMAGMGLEETLRSEGRTLIRTSVGDQNVLNGMLKTGSQIGGESSGHYISADFFPAGDGFLNALRICGAIQKNPGFLLDLENKVPVYPQYEKAYAVLGKPPLDSLKKVHDARTNLEHHLEKEGRCILRYSGTEKKLRLFVEARNLTLVDVFIQELEYAIKEELQ